MSFLSNPCIFNQYFWSQSVFRSYMMNVGKFEGNWSLNRLKNKNESFYSFLLSFQRYYFTVIILSTLCHQSEKYFTWDFYPYSNDKKFPWISEWRLSKKDKMLTKNALFKKRNVINLSFLCNFSDDFRFMMPLNYKEHHVEISS